MSKWQCFTEKLSKALLDGCSLKQLSPADYNASTIAAHEVSRPDPNEFKSVPVLIYCF